MHRPVRIAQELSGEKDDIGVPVPNDLIRLLGRRDHADGSGHHLAFPADLGRERHLEPGPNRNLCIWKVST